MSPLRKGALEDFALNRTYRQNHLTRTRYQKTAGQLGYEKGG